MNQEDVGHYYINEHEWETENQDAWQLISYCSFPTATLRNVRTGEKIGGAVGSLNLAPFIKLVPEREVLKRQGKEVQNG